MWRDEDFRALARSSPWLWGTVRSVVEGRRDPVGLAPVRAWIRRPQAMRVETLDGQLLQAGAGTHAPTNVSVFLVGDGDPTGQPEPPGVMWWTDPAAPVPPRRSDGLVGEPVHLPLHVVIDDPMWQSYRWVAMLNPRELADDHEGGPAVHVDSVEEADRHGRRTLWATVRPRDGYDARCSCCPLLPSRAAALAEGFPDPDGPFADAHLVALDVATGICVSTRELGGPDDGRGFEVTIEAVDEPMPDALFAERVPERGPLARLRDRLGPARPGRWAPT
jgi:hypothetical protein